MVIFYSQLLVYRSVVRFPGVHRVSGVHGIPFCPFFLMVGKLVISHLPRLRRGINGLRRLDTSGHDRDIDAVHSSGGSE